MKALVCASLLFAGISGVDAQIRPLSHRWKATIKVVDENGRAVPGAQVKVVYSAASPDGLPVPKIIDGLTDTKGFWSAEHVDRSVQLDFVGEKTGYYRFTSQHLLGFSEKERPNWNPSVTMILKRIRNPIPMYTMWINSFIPTNGQAIAYDLVNGDWIAPYGQGKSADLTFTTQLSKRSMNDFDYKLTVSFANEGDGIQGFGFPYPTRSGSALRSPHEAPEGGYEVRLVKSDTRRPGQFAKMIWDESTNYFIRVRTTLDERGAVKSALYGKIYGDFNQFRYYLNPTPNDRNVEFAPGQNLITNRTRRGTVDRVDQP